MRSFSPPGSCLALLTIQLISATVQKRDTIVFTNGAGHIHSPNYPDKYPPNSDLQWVIATSEGKRIRLHLIEFELERFRDLLQFYNGSNFGETPSAEITGRCTKQNPDECLNEDINSNRNVIGIRFLSDNSYQYKGFNLSYTLL